MFDLDCISIYITFGALDNSICIFADTRSRHGLLFFLPTSCHVFGFGGDALSTKWCWRSVFFQHLEQIWVLKIPFTCQRIGNFAFFLEPKKLSHDLCYFLFQQENIQYISKSHFAADSLRKTYIQPTSWCGENVHELILHLLPWYVEVMILNVFVSWSSSCFWDPSDEKFACLFFEMDVSENSGFSPQIIHFNRVFHYKPSILGYHYFWKHPYGRRYMNTMAEAMFWNDDERSMSTGFSKTVFLGDHCEKWNHIPTTPANICVIKNSGLPDDHLGQTPAS